MFSLELVFVIFGIILFWLIIGIIMLKIEYKKKLIRINQANMKFETEINIKRKEREKKYNKKLEDERLEDSKARKLYKKMTGIDFSIDKISSVEREIKRRKPILEKTFDFVE